MQITPVNNNTNFGALKSVHVDGAEFTKYPKTAKEILKKIKADKTFTDFFERWDTDIVLHSRKSCNNDVASVMFFYRELPTGNKFVDFFKKLFTEAKHISHDEYGYNFEEAVKALNEHVADANRGVLHGQIHYVNSEADKIAAEKAAKAAEKAEKAAQKAAEKRGQKITQAELDAYIKDMIN